MEIIGSSTDDDLLCDEEWVMMSPPAVAVHDDEQRYNYEANNDTAFTTTLCYNLVTREDCEQAFTTCLHKELLYMTPMTPSFPYLLRSNHFIAFARSRAIHFFTQWRRRFGLSFETVFNAVNYLDRFIYVNQCHGWKYWMVELVSVASFSIACKFGETEPPSLQEIQEGLEHSYEPRVIQRMELTMMKELGWRLNCTTAYSYVELIACEFNSLTSDKPLLLHDLTCRLTDLLLYSILDHKMLEFRPCVIAVSGIKCVLQELLPTSCDAYLPRITSFIPRDQMENVLKCDKMMEEHFVRTKEDVNGRSYPSSPITVLTKERVDIYNGQVDFSLFKMSPDLNINLSLIKKKRKLADISSNLGM